METGRNWRFAREVGFCLSGRVLPRLSKGVNPCRGGRRDGLEGPG